MHHESNFLHHSYSCPKPGWLAGWLAGWSGGWLAGWGYPKGQFADPQLMRNLPKSCDCVFVYEGRLDSNRICCHRLQPRSLIGYSRRYIQLTAGSIGEPLGVKPSSVQRAPRRHIGKCDIGPCKCPAASSFSGSSRLAARRGIHAIVHKMMTIRSGRFWHNKRYGSCPACRRCRCGAHFHAQSPRSSIWRIHA